jgi:cell division protein FtsB
MLGLICLRKIFLGILIFVFFLTQVNAIVVTDIQQQIQTGNEGILRSNAEMTAQITALNTEVKALSTEIKDLKSNVVMKSDLPQVYANIQQLQRDANGQQLATLLAVVLCTFALMFIAKARGWL